MRATNDFVFAHSPDILSAIDTAGRFVRVSEAVRRVLGYAPSEVEGRPYTDFMHPDDIPETTAAEAGVWKGQPVQHFRNRYLHRDGAVVEMEWSAEWPGDGDLLLAIGRDATVLRASARALAESEARYRTLFTSMDQGFCLCEMVADEHGRPVDFRYLEVNDAFAGMTGLEDAAGRLAREIIPGLEDEWVEQYARVGFGGERLRFENRAETLGRWFDVYAAPAEPVGGGRFVVLFTNVSARRAAEAALRASDERARLALDIARVGTYDWDLTTGDVTFDRRALEVVGLAVDAAPSAEIFASVIHPDDTARVQASLAAALAGDGAWQEEHRVVHADGAVRWIVSRGRVMFEGDGDARRPARLAGALLDVTAEREAETALRASEQRARLALEAGRMGVWEWDLASDAVAADAPLRALWAVGADAPLTAADLFGQIHPDDVARVRAEVERALGEGGVYNAEFRVVRPGGAFRWLAGPGRVVPDAEGRPVRLAGVNFDVTERRRADDALRASEAALRALNANLEARVAERTAELEAANQQLEVRNRELQDFAHVASHDLQEPLRKIRSFAGLLATDEAGTLTDDGRHYVARTQAAAERMSGLIRDLLAFSRVASRQNPVEAINLDDALQGVLRDLDASLEASGGSVVAETLGTVHGDPVQIRQLLQNLVGNALKYHRAGAPPTVRVRTEHAGGHVRIVVEDDGIGFDPRHAERIFAPFQRLHGRSEYEGTGMGLAIVRRVAERHGGTVAADGRPGEGATFSVTLPAG